MRLFYLVLLFLLLAPAFAGAQAISINTDASNPDPSAILDIKSTNKGVLAPRMTTAQRTAIAAPATGLLVFDTTTGGFWFFDNGIWNQIASIALSPPLASGANNTVLPIPDNNPAGITSIINLTQAGVIDGNTQIKVCIDITHTADADLDISLMAPDGTTIDLSSDNGTFSDNYTNTCFTTALAPGVTSGVAPFTGFFTPEQPFSNFINKSIMGNWTLKVVDDRNTDVGQLNWWSIEIPSKSIAPALLSDKDSDTKVQVEKNPDEDIIRFDLSGTEGMVLRKTATGSPRLELTDGLSNTFIGQSAGASNPTGFWNTANGYNALFSNTTGPVNTAYGFNALRSNTTGYQNTANGVDALRSNTTGYSNTANGVDALRNHTTGSSNTANGGYALYSDTTGHENTAIGWGALYSNTTGNFNIANGVNALFSNTTGSNNTALGFAADVANNNLTNATVIGSATVNASNKIRLGNTAVTVIEGQVAYTIPSDARFKFNIHDAVPGLAFIEKLRPVTYQFDTRKFDEHLMQNMPDSIRQRRLEGQDYRESTALMQTGFLAQEVEKACQELNFTFSGLHVPTSAVDNYGIAYGSFVPLLVKGMQEQQAVIETLKVENATQKAENAAQKAENATMKAQLDKITAALHTAGINLENR